MIAGASFLGGMGGLIAANQLGRDATPKFVKTVVTSDLFVNAQMRRRIFKI